MVADISLTDEEIAALRKGIADGSIAAGGGLMPDGEIAAYALGIGESRSLSELHVLLQLNDRMARDLRSVIEPLLRVQPRIRPAVIRLESFADYSDGFGDPLSLHIVRMEPLRGNALLVFRPELVGALVDAFYGGRGIPPASRLPEFTAAEDRIIQTLAERTLRALEIAWKPVLALRLGLLASESHPQVLSYLGGDDLIIVTQFLVELPRAGTTPIDIVYPLQALKPLLPQLRTRAGQSAPDPNWHQQLRASLLDVTLPLRSVVAEPAISLRQLMALKVGDVIPINVSDELRLLIEDTQFAVGRPGEANGNAALQVVSINRPGVSANTSNRSKR